jgi:hypothetical protein
MCPSNTIIARAGLAGGLSYGCLTVLGILMERNRSLTVAAQQTAQNQRDWYRAATVRERFPQNG